MDLLQHWNITAKPFEETDNPAFYSAAGTHAEALSRLQFMAVDGDFGIGVLSGASGTGKTFTAKVFASNLDPIDYLTVYVEYARFGFDAIMDNINCALRNSKPKGVYGSTYSLLMDFRELLKNRLLSTGRKLMLIIDDAEVLSQDDLNQIRALTGEVSGTHNAMTVLLLGNEELALNIRANKSVNSRVGLRYRLNQMSVEDVAEYILTKINAVGGLPSAMFTPPAIQLLAKRSAGYPRALDQIAKLAMYSCAMRGAHTVTYEDVGSVAADMLTQAA